MSETPPTKKVRKADPKPAAGMSVSLVRIFGRLPQGSQEFLPSTEQPPATAEQDTRRKRGR